MTRHVGGIRDGARVSLRTKIGPVWAKWEIEHRDYVAGQQFRDVLLSGPFATWEHRHRIEPDGEAACVLTDEIHDRLPLGGPRVVAAALLVLALAERMPAKAGA